MFAYVSMFGCLHLQITALQVYRTHAERANSRCRVLLHVGKWEIWVSSASSRKCENCRIYQFFFINSVLKLIKKLFNILPFCCNILKLFSRFLYFSSTRRPTDPRRHGGFFPTCVLVCGWATYGPICLCLSLSGVGGRADERASRTICPHMDHCLRKQCFSVNKTASIP